MTDLYLAICYRWGNTNNHWYFLYCGDDETKACALAKDERDGRSGKYGVAVYRITQRGEDMELHQYFPSGNEDEPFLNWRIEMIERLGHLMLDYMSGRVLGPNPENPGTLKYHDVPKPCDFVMRRAEEIGEQAHTMADAHAKSREDARERRERIWCVLCDRAPVYLVEYTSTFLRVPRDETSGTIEVDDLQGSWCRSCEQLYLTPDQIRANQGRIWLVRHKAEAEQGEDV